ncbi:MAG: FtsH protease activity modulator HflK [Alphaproteobacteria bacterium]
MADSKSPWGRRGGTPGGNRPGLPSGPGGAPGGAGGGKSFDFEAAWRRFWERFEQRFGGPQNEARIAGIALAALALLWLASGIYRVNSDELGVVLRFGKYERTSGPGLNYHLPYPVEQVVIPSVTSVNKLEIGDRNATADNPTVRRDKFALAAAELPQNREGLMLTADRNIVDIGFEVQWKIDGAAPEKFLFNVRDPAQTVHAVAESAMREVIGRHALDDILTTAQSEIAEETRTIMQQVLDSYDAGIEITAVNLSRPDVPQPVIDEFQDVKRAQQDKQTAESVAEGYRNEVIPKAKGDAAQIVQQAQAYKAQVVAVAQGDAARFGQIYAQYVKAKDVTKRRMYLETMEDVLQGMPKVIVDQAGKGSSNLMQLVPLPVVKNALAVAPAPQPVPPPIAIPAPPAAAPASPQGDSQ